MSTFVSLTPRTTEHGNPSSIIVNLDWVTAIRPGADQNATLTLFRNDGEVDEIIVQESPLDILTLAKLGRPFSVSDWSDALNGRLSGFELTQGGTLTAALVEDDIGALATFNADSGTGDWVFGGIQELDASAKSNDGTTLGAVAEMKHLRKFSSAHTGQSSRERLAEGAVRAVNTLSSLNAPGTKQGLLACAWAVNVIAMEALGHEIGGGLSTIKMFEALSKSSKEIPPAQSEPGDIVISPTVGRNIGHVGIIVGAGGVVASNSSQRALFVKNYTLETWRARFVDKKKLNMHTFRLT